MNTVLKKIIFVIVFILATLILPGVLLLMFVDATQGFSVFVIVYAIIIFGILGYIVFSVRNMENKLENTMEEIKMQNAAIAYRLTSSDNEADNVPVQQTVKVEIESKDSAVDSTNIPLNPAEPLIIPTEKTQVKGTDDGFDDFK